MKKIALLVILSFSIITISSAQKKIGHVLRKYKNDENVSNISLTGDLTSMMADAELDYKSKITMVDALVFDKGTDVKDKHKKDIKNALSESGFDLLMNAKSKEGRVKIYVKDTGDYINELYAHLLVEGVNIHFILAGEIFYDDLSKLQLGFQGSDAFREAVQEEEKIKEK